MFAQNVYTANGAQNHTTQKDAMLEGKRRRQEMKCPDCGDQVERFCMRCGFEREPSLDETYEDLELES